MSREIDDIRSRMQKLYDDGKLKCDKGFFEDLDKLAIEAGECMDRLDRNSAMIALHRFWDRAGSVIDLGNDPETGMLYLKIWGLMVRHRSYKYSQQLRQP
jgi:hypothetical protein